MKHRVTRIYHQTQTFAETLVCSKFCLFEILGEFVRNFGRVFAILLELYRMFFEFKRGTKTANKNIVNKLAFPN